MFKRIIENDIKNSKLISLATLFIISAAAVLVSSAIVLAFNLFSSIDTLMTNAKTPHFMQMHSGNIDMKRLNNFSKNNALVDQYQVLDFLNIEGADILINDSSLADSIQDNGFSVQSEAFDYLLDLDGNIINVSDGEIYLPISFMKEKRAKVGDRVTIHENIFHVAGFLRDSQMNSSLASSKRYLISKNDYSKISDFGSKEYLIEFRLNDLSELSTFENEYISASLEANGPTITYPLFRMINAISDGLMIAVILLISILILAIAFMCIRFTLLAKIEDDYREIGVMKAIGLALSDIKKIYLLKYASIAAGGCLLGLIISIPIKDLLLKNIRLYMGESENTILAPISSILGVCIIFLTILLYVNRVLKRFKKISAADALRYSNSEKVGVSKHFSINTSKLIGSNAFLGIKDVLSRKRLYGTLLIILILATFIMIVPQNLYNTISSKKFVTYMGVGDCNLRIDIQQSSNIKEKTEEISQAMKNDKNISKYVALYTKSFNIKSKNGTDGNLKVELGDHSTFPVTYHKGKAPILENEIALSATNSEELGKDIGDTIILEIDGEERSLTISGIYSDITNGGKTAKATFSSSLDDVMWSVISVKTISEDVVNDEVEKYSNNFTYAKVSDISEYMNQTFGSTKDAIKMASFAAIASSIIICILITSLFIRMLMAKDKYSIAVMKSLGFTNNDIKIQYISRTLFVLFIGIILGTVLANTLGKLLAGMIISSLGVTTFSFIINPITAYILSPVMLICAVVIASILSTSNLKEIKISENIKE